MEVKYTKKEVIDIIKLYYKKMEDRDVDVRISTKKDLVGRFESVACVTTIKVIEKINLFGIEKEVTKEIENDKLTSMINELLNEQGYKIKTLFYNDGLENRTVGYGMGEHTETSAYFRGITVLVDKKLENQVTLKKVVD